MMVKGRDLVSGIPKTVRVNSAEIRECMLEPIHQIVGAVRRALEITPPELAADIVDRGIVMTGGGSLSAVSTVLLREETGLLHPRRRRAPDLRGAGDGSDPRRLARYPERPDDLTHGWLPRA